MNYNSLVLDLQKYMLRTDPPFLDKIPDIIEQGIIRIYNNAKDIGFEIQLVAQVLNINDSFIDKPGNWRETTSIMVSRDNGDRTFKYLLPRTPEFCRTYQPDPNIIGVPKFYSDVALVNNGMPSGGYGRWQLTPAADAQYSVLVTYLGLPLFNVDNPVNFLTQRYPNLSLYSCLLESSLFLDNEEKKNKYEIMFGKELETINNMNNERITDRTIVRDKS